MRPRVKICCIASIAEAHLAIRHGADAVGLVSAMPSGPGVIPDARIAEISASIPPGVASFLLTSQQSVAAIVEQQRRLRPTTIQICDRLATGTHAELRQALPGIGLVQVVHVTGEESVAAAVAVAAHVDALLLDSGNQALAVKQLGGTGRQHDWNISRRIRAAVGVPVYLAGGLRADNVASALAEVAPFGVDVCSGVRTDGHLDAHKLAAFVRAVRDAGVTRTHAPVHSAPVRVKLEPPSMPRAAAFLDAVRRSRVLHDRWVSPPSTLAQYRAFVQRLRKPTHASYLVCTEQGALAGVVNISEIVRGAFRGGYLGYYGFVPFQGRGYMRAGLSTVIGLAFGSHGLHRLEANIQPENERSIALVQNLGFRFEGYSPRYLKIAGRWRDHERWALTKELRSSIRVRSRRRAAGSTP